MKNVIVYCVREVNNDKVSFFVKVNGQVYYLFSQKFYCSVFEFYKNGKLLQDALSYKKKNRYAHSLNKTADKLIPFIRYIEQSEGMTILKKTEKKNRMENRKRGCDKKRKEIFFELDSAVA